jgi:PleD family two-component response regulator
VVVAGVPPFTVSIGLADSTHATTAAAIIAYADAALMSAKQEGRDRLIIAAKPDQVVSETSWAAG